jgi:hypothetical protein
MPGIIDLQTNLRDLPYSTDSKQPYIRTRIPAYGDPGPKALLGKDVIGRNGQIGAALEDVSRITKWGFDGIGGLLAVVKDNGLALTNPKPLGNAFSGVRPRRLYNPLNTIAQIAVQGTGLHLNRNGILPFLDEQDTYINVVKNSFSGNQGGPNRLTSLRKVKLLGETITPTEADELSVNGTDENILIDYGGGPGSVLGIGRTKVRRSDFTEEWVKVIGSTEQSYKRSQIVALTYKQLDQRPDIRTLGTGLVNLPNFAQTLLENTAVTDPVKKHVLGRIADYSSFNRDETYNAGDPGNSLNLDREAYYEGVPKQSVTEVKGVDRLNYQRIYTTNDGVAEGYEDIIKFYFAVLDNDDPQQKVYTHFRAYLTNFGDSYSSEWNSFRYMGRGENFYRYSGFDRSVNLGFQVHVGSRAELFPTYDKLNYLASVTAPDYSEGGFMRGNIIELTVGDYLNNVPGIIEKLDFSFPMDSPWEIARKDDGSVDQNSAELPTLVEVSMNFKPIERFLPRTINSTTVDERFFDGLDTLPESQFISMGSDNKGYKSYTT